MPGIITLSSSGPLRGELSVPGDKSISHRAVMFGSLAQGRTVITGFLSGADCLSSVDCFRRLGVEIETDEKSHIVNVYGKGMHSLVPAGTQAELYTGNSGTTTRIISGILAPQPFTSILSGDDSVNSRPMSRIIRPLSQMGAEIESLQRNGCAPLKITGRPLHGITWHSPVASAQVKSAILCAGLYAEGNTEVIEPSLSRDHTERMLQAFGAKIQSFRTEEGWAAAVQPCSDLTAASIDVPGDISSAAFFITAALITPGSEILIRNAGCNPTRSGILTVFRNMGAQIDMVSRGSGHEPTADLLIRHQSLRGTVIEGDIIPALIDEIPAIAVAAAFAEGTTVIRNAAELKVKESDRIEAVCTNLRAMNGDVTPTDDGMIIRGGRPVQGAKIKSYSDHRIAMSFAAAAMAAEGETQIEDAECVGISYPSFWNDLKSIGGKFAY